LQTEPHPSPQNRIYIAYIDRETTRADQLQNIATQTGLHGGIWTQAALFVNGQRLYQTNPVESGHGEGYLAQEPRATGGWERQEQLLSQTDSEVGTLSAIGNWLGTHVAQVRHQVGPIQGVAIYLTGNLGPCEGCKSRIEQLRRDIIEMLGPDGAHARVLVEANYTTPTNRVTRGEDVETQYGYPNDQAGVAASGQPFFSYRVEA
jgi:hypothetical protein